MCVCVSVCVCMKESSKSVCTKLCVYFINDNECGSYKRSNTDHCSKLPCAADYR